MKKKNGGATSAERHASIPSGECAVNAAPVTLDVARKTRDGGLGCPWCAVADGVASNRRANEIHSIMVLIIVLVCISVPIKVNF